ncbi:hypothetical protein TRVL_10172 [Trypanosoma vivax]|nr:hypothetical protein TRVL_10172 [Trypanosoma vivax]
MCPSLLLGQSLSFFPRRASVCSSPSKRFPIWPLHCSLVLTHNRAECIRPGVLSATLRPVVRKSKLERERRNSFCCGVPFHVLVSSSLPSTPSSSSGVIFNRS